MSNIINELENLSDETMVSIIKECMNHFNLEINSQMIPLFAEAACIKHKIITRLKYNNFEPIKSKENYDKLLKSGMFFKIYPSLTGEYDKDKIIMERINEI
ncbi:MAG: hypothetical protein P8X70_01500 [Nanoarchaeota archaeon]